MVTSKLTSTPKSMAVEATVKMKLPCTLTGLAAAQMVSQANGLAHPMSYLKAIGLAVQDFGLCFYFQEQMLA